MDDWGYPYDFGTLHIAKNWGRIAHMNMMCAQRWCRRGRSPEGTSPKPMFFLIHSTWTARKHHETNLHHLHHSIPCEFRTWQKKKKKTRKNHLSPHLETNYDHEKPGKSHEIPHLSSLPRRRTSIRPGSHFGAGSDLSLKSEWAKGRLSVAARPGGIPNGHRNSGC